VYFREDFAAVRSLYPPTYLLWLISIAVREAEVVRKNGGKAFETKLKEHDPDLLDLNRGPMTMGI